MFSERISLQHLTGLAFPENPPEGFTLADLTFDRATFDRLRALHPLCDPTNPDLAAFEADGGKLILYHGWSDTDVSPVNTIAYYEAVRERMGAEAPEGFARLYLFPGMYHCSQGEGPFEFDLLTPLMAWVEKGEAPDAVVVRQPVQAGDSGFGQARRGSPGAEEEAEALPGCPAIVRLSGDLVRSRPVHPYPVLPAFADEGDPNDVARWSRGKATVTFEMPDWAGADFFRPYEPVEFP